MNEQEEARALLKRAVVLAHNHGMALAEESTSIREALVAVAIMFSSLGASAGCNMHQLMGLLMETYKQQAKMMEDDQ